jgi:ParB-like chromosome segregation protein Spo0J
MSKQTVTLRIAEIRVLSRKRGIDPANVDRLANSISSIGVIIPIVVRTPLSDNNDAYVLVAGLHRLEAAKKLGLGCIYVGSLRTVSSRSS